MSAEVTLTVDERETWDRDPDEWPHTPPFHVFRALMDEDDNTWWRAGSGHGLNAYEAAVERVEELESAVERERGRIANTIEDELAASADYMTPTVREGARWAARVARRA